jgi:hypothetical protein
MSSSASDNASLFIYVAGRRVHESPRASGIIALPHATEYTIGVYNHDDDRDADARVQVDGKFVGLFRVKRRTETRVERSSREARRLTFYDASSGDAAAGRLGWVSRSDLGLVQITMFYAKLAAGAAVHDVETDGGSCRSSDQRAGGTALGAPSAQRFVAAEPLEYDPALRTTLYARLVVRDAATAAVVPL